MSRLTTLARQFGILVFALGLVVPQMVSAAPPPVAPAITGTLDPALFTSNPLVFQPRDLDVISNVVVSAPAYNKGIVTATISFYTGVRAPSMVTWGPQCWQGACEFPLPAGFDGYDATGYAVQHITGEQADPPGTELQGHIITLTGLMPSTPYEFLISADLPDGHVHTFYGRFTSGQLIIG